jgi:hypothetical protein
LSHWKITVHVDSRAANLHAISQNRSLPFPSHHDLSSLSQFSPRHSTHTTNMTLSNLCFGDIDTFSDDEGSSGSETAMGDGGVEIVPQDADVLLGRGTKHQFHPGNMRYSGKAHVILSVALQWQCSILCLTRDHCCLTSNQSSFGSEP